MIERAIPLFKSNLVFDRNAIVRAALRAYVESCLYQITRLGFPAIDSAMWEGDLQRGAIYKDDGCGDYEVVAWTEVGVVGLACDLGSGPIEQLGLPVDAVTGGPDDVRGAVADLPEELEPALVLATGMLEVGSDHGEKQAGAGFWLCGDRSGGTLFTADDLTEAWGVTALAAWGLLWDGRLPRACGDEIHFDPDEPEVVPIHAIMDAVVDRRLEGPTELTTDELAMLTPEPPDPAQLLGAQRALQLVDITWPGSPEIPPSIDSSPNPYVRPDYLTRCFGPVVFNRDAIVRAALRAYVETILAPLDPRARHVLTACVVPKWTGDLQRGAFFNGDGCGDYDVVAWTEAGVVGLAYKRGFGPIEQLGLSVDAVNGGPDDVRTALPELPAELLPAFEMAVGLLEVGAHSEKLAGVGFWQHGDRAAGTLFDDPTLMGARRLVAWGALDQTGKGRLPWLGDRKIAALAAMLARTTASPIHALLDAVVDRRLGGPTELLPDELATLSPELPDPEERLSAQRMLQKVGITWPGASEIPKEPRGAGRLPLLASPRAIGRSHPLGFLVFDREAIIRAAFRAHVEATLAYLDPRQCHPMLPDCGRTSWTGNLQRGALSSCTTVAWTEAGVVGLASERGPGPTVWIDLSVDLFMGSRDDVRRAVPDLPDELLPAFDIAFGRFNPRHPGEKLIAKQEFVGFWLCGDRVGGTLFDTRTGDGVWSLATWGRIGRGRLLPAYRYSEFISSITEETFRAYAPFLAVVDAVVERALTGPTELTLDELTTLFPLPPLPGPALPAQRNLQKVGITWPGSPEIPPL